MQVDVERCIGCGTCIPFCPAGAISMLSGGKAHVDEDACFECGTCYRAAVVQCPSNAFYEQPGLDQRPRSLRRSFSDPSSHGAGTDTGGRGTAGVKTNDITNRVRPGFVGLSVDMGRPVLGVSFAQVEAVTEKLAASRLQILWEQDSSLVGLFDPLRPGSFRDNIGLERVLSASIEFHVPEAELWECLVLIKQVVKQVGTVASLSVIARLEPDGRVPKLVLAGVARAGLSAQAGGKVNLGLGRPTADL